MNSKIQLHFLIFIGIAIVLSIASCSKTDQNFVLAKFDNGTVNYKEYLDHYLLSTQYKPDKFPTIENLKEIVELKAIEKMAVQEALEQNIDKDSTYLTIVRNNERRLLFQKYVNSRFTDEVITDSLIRKFYNEYSPQYYMKYILRPIIKSSSPEFVQSQKDTIWEAYNMLIKGADFGDVAKKFSQDITTKNKGGEIGWIIEESMGDHIVRSVMDTLKENSISKPFRGYGGYYILYKGGHRDVEVPPFNQVRGRIWKSLYHSRRAYIQDLLDHRFDELSRKYHYQLHEDKIWKALKKAGYKRGVSKYRELDFSKLTDKDKKMKIADYDGGFIQLGDLFANSKKAPINKFEFDKRVESIAREHLIAKHANEINLQNVDELPEQLESMKTSLLRAILFQKKVKDKVDEQLKELGAEKDPGKRNEIKIALQKKYEDYLKTKYNFSFVEKNFNKAIELATDAKKEFNLKNKK